MVDPAMAGPNTIRLELMEGEAPASGVDAMCASRRRSRAGGSGRFASPPARRTSRACSSCRAAQLPIAGDWQLRIEVGRGEFELMTQTVSVRVEEEF